MSQFFTRSGDDGTTGLLGAGRVAKDHPRMEALGALDEASAALGLARASMQSAHNQKMVLTIQRQLYNIMAEVAATPENAARFRVISATQVTWLEAQIELLSEQTQVPSDFI
ncbi:MAG: ATP:cob(I)alamin adenosyltransferase, partial [Anaerolineales bacterium]|nr:ATP:cob(I)alamin adenosyltransferase [Anaerolineales bacterium]